MHRVALGGTAGRGGGFGGRGAVVAPPKDACTGAIPEAPAGRGGRGGGRGGRGGGGLLPGQYTVRLTVDGQTYAQPVALKPDPRGVPEGAN